MANRQPQDVWPLGDASISTLATIHAARVTRA